MGDKKAYGPLNAAFAGIHLLWSHPDGPYPSGGMNHPDHRRQDARHRRLAASTIDNTGEGRLSNCPGGSGGLSPGRAVPRCD